MLLSTTGSRDLYRMYATAVGTNAERRARPEAVARAPKVAALRHRAVEAAVQEEAAAQDRANREAAALERTYVKPDHRIAMTYANRCDNGATFGMSFLM